MSSALHYASGDIGVNLSITLSTFKVDALLFSDLLEAGALPLGEPSLVVGFGPRVLGVETLGVPDSPLSLACGHKDLCAALGLLDNITCFVLFALLWHAILYQFLHVIVYFIT